MKNVSYSVKMPDGMVVLDINPAKFLNKIPPSEILTYLELNHKQFITSEGGQDKLKRLIVAPSKEKKYGRGSWFKEKDVNIVASLAQVSSNRVQLICIENIADDSKPLMNRSNDIVLELDDDGYITEQQFKDAFESDGSRYIPINFSEVVSIMKKMDYKKSEEDFFKFDEED